MPDRSLLSLVDLLAELFSTEAEARDLLLGLDVEVPRGLLPGWSNGRRFWRETLDQLDSGMVAGLAPRDVVRAAHFRYPGNHQLREWHGDPRLDELREALVDAEGEQRAAIEEEIVDLRRQLRDRELKAGDLLGGGRFKLRERLGVGGFGEVWAAFDKTGQRKVAVKVLHSQYSQDRTRRERFLRGARKMAALEHPGIVKVLELPEDGEDCLFAMEYLPGGDLRQAVKSGAISREAALERVLEVGEALAYAHEKGVVHRDIKPANILLTADGRAKLTDFDLVRAADTTGGTRTQGMGSFLYAPPEMMASAKDADGRADVYGLCATVAFVLNGEDLPPEILWETEGFLERLEATDAVCSVLLRGLAKRPEQRASSMPGFCNELREALSPEPEQGRTRPKVLRSTSSPADVEELFSEIETPDAGTIPLWCDVPAGTFMMGSPESEEDRDSDEKLHEVRIPQPFQMMAVPVTNAMYRAFEKDFEPQSWAGVTEADLAFHPVVNVSWEDATHFSAWLAKKLPGVRLPTETEWEYCCRAGTSTRYWSGDEEEALRRVGWYGRNSEGRTHRVGEKAANPWGLYDVHGNVREWCADWYDVYPSEPGTEPAMSEYRVYRGGSWFVTTRYVRAACRRGSDPSNRWLTQGFRLTRSQVTL